MDLRAIETQIRDLPLGKQVYVEVASPPYGNYTGYHANLTRAEAVALAIEVARCDAPDEVALEVDEQGDLLMSINEVKQ